MSDDPGYETEEEVEAKKKPKTELLLDDKRIEFNFKPGQNIDSFFSSLKLQDFLFENIECFVPAKKSRLKKQWK